MRQGFVGIVTFFFFFISLLSFSSWGFLLRTPLSSQSIRIMDLPSTPPRKRTKTGKGDDKNEPFSYDSPILTSDAAQRLERLTLLSFNIAGCQPSAEAPRGWTQKDSVDSIREKVSAHNPDIITLQECPGTESWAMSTFLNYQVIGATPSHADHVILLVKKGIHATRVNMSPRGLPVVMAKLTYQLSCRSVFVASAHLAPFKEGEDERRNQIANVISSVASVTAKENHPSGLVVPPSPLIVAGDMNMRQSEDVGMKHLGWIDFWQMAGSQKATKFTWDTMNHGTSFNRYYGDSTREYNARYDRIYFHNGGDGGIPLTPSLPSTTSNTTATSAKRTTKKKKEPTDLSTATTMLNVESFELMANKPITSKTHFLSDHFGIVSTFELKWPA